MSYDTSIKIDTGAGRLWEIDDIGNITCNVSPMYKLALPGPYEGGGKYDGEGESVPRGGLPGVSGLKCSDAMPIIENALNYMDDHEDDMVKLEPENGWGNFESAYRYLWHLYFGCKRHPNATVCVGW